MRFVHKENDMTGYAIKSQWDLSKKHPRHSTSQSLVHIRETIWSSLSFVVS